MAIYDAGTASLAADGTVTGVGTAWRQPLTLIRVGATMIFKTNPVSIVTIAEIISDTEIRAFNDKGFAAPAGTGYAILAHDGITVQGLAQDVAETLRYYQSTETEVAAAVDTFNNFDFDEFRGVADKVTADAAAAKTSETNAKQSENSALASKNSAAESQTAAANSASAALTSENAAKTSENNARQYADSINPSMLLAKNQNLADLESKDEARYNLQVMHERQASLNTEDLNVLKGDKAGFYYQSMSNNATPERNYPIDMAGCLLVQRSGANDPKSCVQTYTAYGNGRRWIRWLGNAATGRWSQWYELYNAGSSPTFNGTLTVPEVAIGTATLRPVNPIEGSGDGVVWESSNATEASFGIANVGGGSAVFHNYSKPANGSGVANGVLIGGYGSRPWTGTTYTDHSNVSQHFLMDGTASATNHGGWFRLLTTPLNKTNADRRQTLATSNNGDLYIGYDVPMGLYKIDVADYNGLESLNGRGLKQVNNTANEIALITPRNGATANINFRGVAFNGTMTGGKGATQPGDNLWLSFAGHDGQKFTTAVAGIRMQASSGWSTTNTQCGITVATTGPGSTSRIDRWKFNSDGAFSPASDNTYPIGSSASRVTSIFATNGAIQTSDARMKTDVREMTDGEVEAAKDIAKELGFFKWLERVELEGDSARWHAGITVQRVMEIMEHHGLDPMSYGIVCYDKWDESEEFISDPDDESKSFKKITPAGDRYSLRYAELNVFIAKGMEKRISDLEKIIK